VDNDDILYKKLHLSVKHSTRKHWRKSKQNSLVFDILILTRVSSYVTRTTGHRVLRF